VSAGDLYSRLAETQLDELEHGPDPELYNAVLDAIEAVLDQTDTARARSPGLRDAAGRPLFSTVVMHDADPRWFVFWKDAAAGPVILGVAPLPPFQP